MLRVLLCISLAICVVQAEKFSFDGYKLVRLFPTNENHLKVLDNLEGEADFDVWNRIKGLNNGVDVALSPNAYQKYKTVFDSIQMPLEVVNSNIQNMIDEESRSKNTRSSSAVGIYARYSQILEYIESVTKLNPDLASYSSIGNSFEKRELRVLKLSASARPDKQKIWIDCGIHAREWISPSTCIWFIDRLISDYKNDDTVAVELLNEYEFYILPLYNPDGYEYSHDYFRLWRKNRVPLWDYPTFSPCFGVDLNRNYGYQWMVSGSSQNPCADTYAGTAPDSEIETQHVEEEIMRHQGKWASFVTIHSYSAIWMTPWGYTKELPEDNDEMVRSSQVGADALERVNGLKFVVGSPANILYEASGGSFDWTKAVAGIKYSIALELRPGQTGPDSRYGFMLPESRVPDAGEETYQGLKAYFKYIKDNGKFD